MKTPNELIKFSADRSIKSAKKYGKPRNILDHACMSIAADIGDRCGVKHEWGQIEQEIIDKEIYPTWKEIFKNFFVQKDNVNEAISLIKEELEDMGECECGYEEPMGEGYTYGTCRLHKALELLK